MTVQHAGASRRAIEFHYDAGNEFYRHLLGSSMVYSCALFDGAPGCSLEEAQERKIELHLDWAEVAPQSRLLDVGCGWGALLRHAGRRHAGLTAVGLTMSAAQKEYGDGLGGAHQVLLCDWRDFACDQPFDAVTSIGAFEHFARPGVGRARKLHEYRRFFAKTASLLRRGGCLSLQTIAYGSLLPDEQSQFIQSEVFPESELPEVHEIVESFKGLFDLEVLRNDARDYACTLRAWSRNLREHRPRAVELVGEARCRTFARYLHMSRVGFERRKLALIRMKLRKLGDDRE